MAKLMALLKSELVFHVCLMQSLYFFILVVEGNEKITFTYNTCLSRELRTILKAQREWLMDRSYHRYDNYI